MTEVTIYYASAIVLVLAAIAVWALNLVTLPGNWLVLGLAALFAWLFPEDPSGRGITWTTVGVLGGLAVLGEIVEFVAGAAGAAKQGASRRSVALSIVGAIVGSLAGLAVGTPIPVLGSFVMAVLGGALGAFGGAYLGEWWKGRDAGARFSAGQGAFAGRIWGTIGKLAVGAVMLVILTWAALR